jgi:Protein of unknown function (DUF2817)
MIGVAAAFAATYAQARTQFLVAAATAGLSVESHIHPLKGRDGEVLAMDVARSGPADAHSLLIVSSACHGVEGYCGSGVQVFALHDDEWRAKAAQAGVAVLYIHALNPYGFSHLRRTTQENVDLNRNFHDFSANAAALPVNADYAELHPLLVPEHWPPTAANQAALADYVARQGEMAFQAAITRGQHVFADGMFYGGMAPTWSNQTLRAVLRQHGQQAKRLAWIDLHTGLGESGIGERIYTGRDDASTLARARDWWGQGGNQVTSIYDGSSTSAFLTGLMWFAAYQECPQAEYTGIAMEYGTVPVMQTLAAVRADNWLNLHPEASPALAQAIRQQVRDAFYTDTDAWKGQIISQARQAMFQAVEGFGK